jgi:hypothetical protein
MEIQVHAESEASFRVELLWGQKVRSYRVQVPQAALARYGGGASAEALLCESFRFLLEREGPDDILRSFEIGVIERYFPEYPSEIRRRLAGG